MRAGPRLILILLLFMALPAKAARAQWHVDGAPVCTALNVQVYPAIVADGSGGVIIAWQDLRGGVAYDVYAQHILASGAADPAWPADGRAICTANNDQTNVALVSDGAGGAILVWQDIRGFASFDIYAQHVLSSGSLDPGWPASGLAVCTATDDQSFPQLVGDGAGGAIVTWMDARAGAPNFAIYAQHVLGSGTVDSAWPANGRALCAAANDQEAPQIAGDGAGGAIVTWFDGRGADYDIYAQHVLATGAVDPVWPVNGTGVCTATSTQLSPTIVGDGSGGAIVAWYDGRSGSYDIYAQHIGASGSADPAWPANGRALCTAIGDQRLPQLVSDGAHGAIVTWYDLRNVDFDVYAQHVLAGGGVDPGWPANGRALCTATRNQILPRIVGDGAGGAIVTWQDLRNGNDYDVYAQHVQAAGTVDPAWPSDGRALCTAGNDQAGQVIASDGAGGAVVAWYDGRGDSFDIYASRVSSAGALTDVAVSPAPSRFALGAPWPNPVRAQAVSIPLTLSTPARVSVEVLDAGGRHVASLARARELPAGTHSIAWNGLDDRRSRVPPGIYFVRVWTGTDGVARRIAVLER